MSYEVINLETGKSHGTFDTIHAVRKQIAEDGIGDRFQLNLLVSGGIAPQVLEIRDGFRDGVDRKYEVINIDTDESHGYYDTVEEARGCVRFDKITDRHQIDRVDNDGNHISQIQYCEDYLYKNETDDRVLQGLGLPNWSEARI